MKRKLIYITLVLAIALAFGVFNSGCSNNNGEIPPKDEVGQEEVSENLPAEETGDVDSEDEDLIEENKEQVISKNYVTISVTANTILNNLDAFDKAKLEILPEEGTIIPPTKVEIKEGETVFDVLVKVTKDKGIHMEYVSTPIYNSNYIEGIGNIYEIDAGPLSGWMYKVNDWFPNYGCGQYALENGDIIEWVYTCDLGRDVGGDWNEQNKT